MPDLLSAHLAGIRIFHDRRINVPTTLLAGLLAATFAEQLECALLRLVAGREQMLLSRLLTERMFAAADNPAMLILHQILL